MTNAIETRLSTDRLELVQAILYLAAGYDGPCYDADHRLRELIGIAGGQRAAVVLDSAGQLDAEEAIGSVAATTAELHASLAPAVLEWMSDLPDVAIAALVEPFGRSEAIAEILPRLFARAGIADRFRPIDPTDTQTFAPEEPR